MSTPIFPEIDFRQSISPANLNTKEITLYVETLIRVKNPENKEYYYIRVKDQYKGNLSFDLDSSFAETLLLLSSQFHQNFIRNCYYIMHLSSKDSFKEDSKCKFPNLKEKDRIHIKATMNMPGNINSIL